MAITSAQGSLVMVGLNTPSPQVFLNGTLIEGITSIKVVNTPEAKSVVLGFHEDPQITALRAAGVTVKLEAQNG